MTKRILITGASGFTGRHFIAAAKAQGYECIALCHQDGDHFQEVDHCVTADLRQADQLAAIVREIQPTHVLHLAAVSFVAHGDLSEIYQTNLLGTLNLLQALQDDSGRLQRVIVASSANIYGNATDLPITEDTPPQPANHYGVSKYAMERAARLFLELPLTIVRPFNYTGVGQHPNFLVPKIVAAYRDQSPSLELGNLEVWRDFSDVRDVATAYVRLLDAREGSDTFNICSGKPVALREIVDTLAELSGHDLEVTTNPRFVRADEIRMLYGSPEKLERKIGTYRRYELRDTLEWMLTVAA